jgi:sigma-E factor negative regulatory protein RseB
MRLRSPSARVVLPVCGALVLGVGVGSAIGWIAGGGDAASSGDVVAASTASFATASVFTAAPKRSQNDEAVALLQRAMVARSSTPWNGTQIVTTWGPSGKPTSWMVDLSHEPGHGTTALVHGSTTGLEDLTYVPDGDGPESSTDVDGLGPVGLLSRTYTLTVSSGQQVAGYPTTRVDAVRSDGSVAARLWIDRSTGLLLRRELLDATGHVTHSAAFVDFVPGEVQSLSAGQNVTSPWSEEVGAGDLAALRKGGWPCPEHLAGQLVLYDVRRTAAGQTPQVLHLAYSDGLVTVSVFEERGHLDTSALSRYTPTKVDHHIVYVRPSTAGTGDVLTWQAGGIVFTVVADAPSSTIGAVLAGLPTGESSSGGWSRVGRGLHRVGSWVDPTG